MKNVWKKLQKAFNPKAIMRVIIIIASILLIISSLAPLFLM